jgi:hypothetical protein
MCACPGADLQLEVAVVGAGEAVRVVPAAGGRRFPVELPAGPVAARRPAVRPPAGDLEAGLTRGGGLVVDLVGDPYGGAAAVGVAGEDVL